MRVCEKATATSVVEHNWQPPILGSDETDFFQIQRALYALCDPLEAEGKEPLAHVAALLGHVSGFALQFVDPKAPFREICSGPEWRTMNPSDLTAEHLEILKEVDKRTVNLFLKSKINDVLWIKVRPFSRTYAEAAVQNYLDLATKVSPDRSKLYYAKNYTLRAINIWRELGRQPDMRKKIKDVLVKCMNLEVDEPADYTRLFFFENLCECIDHADVDKWINLGNQLAKAAEDQKSFEKARKYNSIVRQFHKFKKDNDSVAASRRTEVELFIAEAKDKRATGAGPSIIQHFYSKAYEAARNTPGMTKEAKALKAEMVDVQTSIPGTFKEFSTPAIDLRPEIEAIQSRMQGQSTADCIRMVAEATVPQRKADLYRTAKEGLKNHPLQALISMAFLDERGKLIAQRPGIGSSPEEELGALRAEATQSVRHMVAIRGTILNWMRREVCNRLDADEGLFDFLLYPNPFVPMSRIVQFRQGLQRGLAGDWISSTAILVPQLENSLRNILHLNGVDVISIDSDGIQQEKDMGKFIYSEDFKAIFGEDMAFQLQVILTDKIGFNLRNQVAHGLLTDGMALSELGPVLWSLTLLLCLAIQRGYQAPTPSENEAV